MVLVAVVSALVGLASGLVIGGRAGWVALQVAGRVVSQPRATAYPADQPKPLSRVA